eukprot:7378103-Prymnesium_polylepis.3
MRCQSIRLRRVRVPIELRSAVLMSFMSEKMRSHSDVSQTTSIEMTTRRSGSGYLSCKSGRAHRTRDGESL